jgi:hypothetical protein
MTGVVESSPGSGVAAETSAPAGGDTSVETAVPVESAAADTPFLIPDNVMNSDLDEVEIPAAPAAVAAPEVQPTVPAEVKPAEAKPAEAAKPATPVEQKPVEAKPADPSAQPSSRPQVVADRAQLLQEIGKNRDALVSHLAQDRFKLTKEESDLLDTDVNAAISKIMARTYYEAMTSAMTLIDRFAKQELVPLIEQHTQSSQSFRNAEDDFFREWPNLDREKDATAINQYANIYRQANPGASKTDAIKMVGQIVSTILGKPKGAPAVPAAKPNGARPFSPASGAARVVSQVQVPEANPFAGMGQEFE